MVISDKSGKPAYEVADRVELDRLIKRMRALILVNALLPIIIATSYQITQSILFPRCALCWFKIQDPGGIIYSQLRRYGVDIAKISAFCFFICLYIFINIIYFCLRLYIKYRDHPSPFNLPIVLMYAVLAIFSCLVYIMGIGNGYGAYALSINKPLGVDLALISFVIFTTSFFTAEFCAQVAALVGRAFR